MATATEILNALNALRNIINYDLIPTFDNEVNIPIVEQSILQNYILRLPSISASKTLLDTKFLEIETILSGLSFPTAPTAQSWHNVTTLRALNTTYTNNGLSPISVSITTLNSSGEWVFYVNDVVISKIYESSYEDNTINCIVPIGATYKVTGSGGISVWSELS